MIVGGDGAVDGETGKRGHGDPQQAPSERCHERKAEVPPLEPQLSQYQVAAGRKVEMFDAHAPRKRCLASARIISS